MKTMIVGHRGSSAEAPENTLASLALAWADGADGVEFDVLMTRDGRAVVHHDESLRRTTGRNALVAELTLDEIRLLDAGSWKGERWKGERIPTLSEALSSAPAARRLFVEVKCGPEIVPALFCDVKESGKDTDQVAFVGFSVDTMRAVKDAFPAHRAILNLEVGTYGGESAKQAVRVAKREGFEGLGPGVRDTVDQAALRAMLDAGLEVFMWTVDSISLARLCREWGVHYVVTNNPGLLRRQLDA